jgi:hypothetical protein
MKRAWVCWVAGLLFTAWGYTSLAGCGGGSGEPASCAPDTIECDGACVVSATDPAHCGGCGKACSAGGLCFAGACLAASCDGVLGLPGAPLAPEIPGLVAVEDFDGDGKLDFAVVSKKEDTKSMEESTVSVLLNQGNRTFGAPITSTASEDFVAVAAADLNGDGKADLAIANEHDASVSVLLNQGNGTFAAPVDYAAGSSGSTSFNRGLAAADLNGDGKPDLVVVYSYGVNVLLNKGDGTFAPAVDHATGDNALSVAVADLNGDGALDLAVTNSTSNTISVLLNQGKGTFAGAVDHATIQYPLRIVASDLNGDGAPDLVFSAENEENLVVLLNQGDGTFGEQIFLAGSTSGWITAADLNGDGKPDLAVWADSLRLYFNQGDGTFADPVDYGRGGLITAGDFDGDGKIDVAAGTAVLFNQGDGSFGPDDYAVGSYPVAVAASDLNGDGKPDIAVANQDGDDVSVLLNQGNGTFAPRVDYPAGPSPSWVEAADLNGDGKTDLAVVNTESDAVSVLLNQGNGTFAGPVSYGAAARPAAVTAADLNGDGKLDLAVANTNPEDGNDGTVSVLLNQGNGTFAAEVAYAIGGADTGFALHPSAVAVSDLNGDDKPDLAVANRDSGDVGVLLNQGDGTFARVGGIFSAPSQYSVAASATDIEAVDLNGDGQPDLAVPDAFEDHVDVLLNQGYGAFAKAQGYGPFNFSAGGVYSFTVVDLNGDGVPDLATARSTDGTVGVLLNHGDGTFEAQANYRTRSFPTSIATADFDGDGRIDVVVASSMSYSVGVLLNKGCLP